MITNGYLFDGELVRKAKERWRLGRVQITLDGTEDVYNKRKAYIYEQGSAFIRVTDNIERLLEADIEVSVRLNLDEHNFDDLIALADCLASRYGKYKNFSAYARYIFDDKKGKPYYGEAESVVVQVSQLGRKLQECGISKRKQKKELKSSIKANYCMADNNAAIAIHADGSLGKCQHYPDSFVCGTVESGIYNVEETERWKMGATYGEVCNACPIFPDCVRIEACPNLYNRDCEKLTIVRTNKMDNLRQSMLKHYAECSI